MPSWEEAVRTTYAEELEKVKREPAIWETDRLTLATSRRRLWCSVENLDFALSLLRDLMNQARRRTRRQFDSDLERIYHDIDQALADLCPKSWKRGRGQLDEGMLQESGFRQARALLAEAFEIWDEIYLDVSLELEARRNRGWGIWTPLIWRFLRDAKYGLDKYLEGIDRVADSASIRRCDESSTQAGAD